MTRGLCQHPRRFSSGPRYVERAALLSGADPRCHAAGGGGELLECRQRHELGHKTVPSSRRRPRRPEQIPGGANVQAR